MSTGGGADHGPEEQETAQVARAVLTDGSVVTVRPLEVRDLAEVERLHSALSEVDRYFRFFGVPSEVALERFVRRLVDQGDAHALALGAFDGHRLIGVGHFEVLIPEVAEVAFVVERARHARGVGTLLLEHLVSAARRRGLREFRAEVLAANSAMMRVFQDSGLQYDVSADGSSYQVTIALDAGEPYYAKVSDRERVADIASLRRVLCPASVAVIGASHRASAVGNALLGNIIRGGYTGRMYAVNRSGGEVLGLTAHRSASDLPETPELAVLCVPAEHVPDVAEECGDLGVRALVVVTAGISGCPMFAEGLVAAVRRWGMRLLGPNCLGLVNTDPVVRLDATFSAAGAPRGEVGLATQSGGVGIALIERLSGLGLGISTMVSTGDKYDVSGNDMLLWWERDPRTIAGVLYLESFGNPRKFAWLARRFSERKPLIVLRSGASPIAQRAALSHTAAAATPSTTRDALLRHTGAIGVDDLGELVAVLGLLSWQRLPKGPRVAVVSNAGGLGLLAAESCAQAGLEFSSLPEAGPDLAALLPEQASSRNPVDTTAAIDAATFAQTVEFVLRDETVDAVVVPVLLTAVSDPIAGLTHAVSRARARGCDTPVLAVRAGQEESLASLVDGEARIPVFADHTLAAQALADVTTYSRWLKRSHGVVPDLAHIDVSTARDLVGSALDHLPAGGWLGDDVVRKLLGSFGLPSVPSWECATEDEAVVALREFDCQVVLKAHVEGLVHKGRAGGVVLGVATVPDLRAGWARLRARFGTDLRGVTVQPMVAQGREFLVGTLSEPALGPMIVFALGGTDTDLIADRSRRLLPLTTGDAEDMLHELRAGPQLFGPRSDETLDRDAVTDVLLRTARLAELLPEIAEVDLNPLIVTAGGVQIPDARIRLEPREIEDPLIRRLRL